MINYFGIEILQFPLTFLIFINFIFGIYNLSDFLIKKFSKNIKLEIKLMFLFLILGTFISLINVFIFINFLLAKYIVYIFFIFFLILNFLFLKNFQFKNIFFKTKKSFDQKIIFIFLICYFIISSLPLSDADSLSYHSSFGAFTLKYESLDWLKIADLIHPDFLVSGFTEIFNFVGLVLYSENFGSYLNFATLIFISFYFSIKFKLIKEKNFILMCILSSPILLPMIFSQKIFVLPSFVLSLIFFYIYKNKFFFLIDELIILASLMLILSFKVSFLYPVCIAILYLIYKTKRILKTSILSFLLSLVFFAPIIFKNIYFHGDLIPPFTGQILNNNSEYLNTAADFFKNYDLSLSLKNLIFLPILFLIPHYGQGGNFFLSFPNIGKIFGLQFYNFINLKKKIDIEIFILFLLLFISVIITSNISTRWFLFIFFLTQIFVCHFELKINIIFKKLIYFQTIIFGIFLVAYSIYTVPALMLKDYKNFFLSKHANGYDFALKINDIKKKFNLKDNEKILYTHRSRFWTNVKSGDLNFSNEWLRLFKITENKFELNNQFLKLVENNDIKILIIRKNKNLNKLLRNSLFKKCDYKYGDFNANYATRNPFFSGVKKYQWIYFENFNLNECIKNE